MCKAVPAPWRDIFGTNHNGIHRSVKLQVANAKSSNGTIMPNMATSRRCHVASKKKWFASRTGEYAPGMHVACVFYVLSIVRRQLNSQSPHYIKYTVSKASMLDFDEDWKLCGNGVPHSLWST